MRKSRRQQYRKLVKRYTCLAKIDGQHGANAYAKMVIHAYIRTLRTEK